MRGNLHNARFYMHKYSLCNKFIAYQLLTYRGIFLYEDCLPTFSSSGQQRINMKFIVLFKLEISVSIINFQEKNKKNIKDKDRNMKYPTNMV